MLLPRLWALSIALAAAAVFVACGGGTELGGSSGKAEGGKPSTTNHSAKDEAEDETPTAATSAQNVSGAYLAFCGPATDTESVLGAAKSDEAVFGCAIRSGGKRSVDRKVVAVDATFESGADTSLTLHRLSSSGELDVIFKLTTARVLKHFSVKHAKVDGSDPMTAVATASASGAGGHGEGSASSGSDVGSGSVAAPCGDDSFLDKLGQCQQGVPVVMIEGMNGPTPFVLYLAKDENYAARLKQNCDAYPGLKFSTTGFYALPPIPCDGIDCIDASVLSDGSVPIFHVNFNRGIEYVPHAVAKAHLPNTTSYSYGFMAFRLAGNPRAGAPEEAMRLHFMSWTAQPDKSIFAFSESLGTTELVGFQEINTSVAVWALKKEAVAEVCQ